MTIPMPLHEHEVTQALEIARAMARVGIPIFVAPPCAGTKCIPSCLKRNGPRGSKIGFHLPGKWEQTTADERVVDQWKVGYALCAVGGCTADYLDVDPRAGGDTSAAQLSASGLWPYSYGRQATPSGGTHDIIAPLHVGTAAPIGNGTDGLRKGIDLRGGRPDGEGRGFIYLAPTVRPSKVDGVPRGYRWLRVPDLAALVAHGPSDVSGRGIAAISATVKKPKTNASLKSDDFFEPGLPKSTVDRRIRERLDSVTAHAQRGWDGFRDTLRDASFEIGGYVGGGYPEYDAAQQALGQAILYAGQFPDKDDLLWIAQGLDDGSGKPIKIQKDAPPRPVTPSPKEESGGKDKKGPRRLPLISDQVWNRRPWLRAIRDRAQETTAVPDATLGAALSIYASSVDYQIKVRTGIKDDLGLSLLVGIVGGSGLGKSTGWKLAKREFAPLDAPRPSPTPTGEGLAEKLMGWVEHTDPSSSKSYKKHEQVRHSALFTIGEGAAMNVTMERSGATLGPVLRQVFSDEDLGTTTASEERHRDIPGGSYVMGVVVLYQETTAMKIINDTDTGTAQRFLWFSGHSPSAPATGAPPAYRMVAPRVTALPREELPDGSTAYVLGVEPAITARLRTEDAEKRDSYSLGDANRDSQKPAVVAKVAALACLIEGRTLVTQDDWDLGEELYAASRAVQDELIELAEEQDRSKRREAAAKAGESDHVRKTFLAQVGNVAASIVRKGLKVGHSLTKREITQVINSKKRAYIPEALDLSLEQGWLDADGDKYKVGSVPLPHDM